MKLVITGGHLSPLLSIIDSLPQDVESLVIGRKYALEGDSAFSLEYNIIKSKNILFKSITAGRLQRKLTRHTLFSLIKFPYGLLQSFLILKKFNPDIILAFGGYVSFPVILAGFILRLPIVIHEQTLEAGLTNKIGSIFAKKVCISWESSRRFFPPKKTVLTGNPIRKFRIPRPRQAKPCQGQAKRGGQNSDLRPELRSREFRIQKEGRPIIYITGGSLGSHSINTLVKGCIEKLLEKFIVIHQTGDAKEYLDFDRLQQLRHSFPVKLKQRYFLTKFVDPNAVGSILQKADLVVSRSGMNTVSELIFFKKPCLLIPLPFSQGNEQNKNALFLKSLGFGEILDQNELTSEELYRNIVSIIENLNLYKSKIKDIKEIIKEDGAEKIIEVLKNEIKC